MNEDRVMSYKLADDGKTPVPIYERERESLFDEEEWKKQERLRRTAQTTIWPGVLISTVFLRHDHNFGFDGPPILWETMIFGLYEDEWQERYTSHEEALVGHARAVKLARGAWLLRLRRAWQWKRRKND